MALLIFLLIFVFCLLAYLCYRNVYYVDQQLKCFANAPEIPIFGHTLSFMFGSDYLNIFRSYNEKYGANVLVKIGPTKRILVSSDYRIFKLMAGDTKFLKRASEYGYFSRWLGTGIVMSDGARWKRQRKLINPTFNYNILSSFVDDFEKNAKILVQQFSKCLNQTSVDVFDMVSLCSLDIICETLLRTPIKAQENSDSETVKGTKSMLKILIDRFFIPHKMFDCAYYFTDNYKMEIKTLKIWDTLTANAMELRRRKLSETPRFQLPKRNALLDHLHEANSNGEQLTLKEIRDNINTFVFAGHETVASTVSFTLHCLANHPEVQEKVFQEVFSVLGDDLQRDATYDDLTKLKYLEMVIKESLRLYPSVAFLPKEVCEDTEYNGTVLPQGLTIIFFYFALHRNPEYFSKPNDFIPERFLIDKTPFAYFPFGYGPRSCVGQKFAMLETKTVISRIIRHFKLLPAIPIHRLQLESHLLLVSSNGVRIRFEKRQ